MRKFTHHHITRHDNQIFVGTQNPIPGLDLNSNDQQTNNTFSKQNTNETKNDNRNNISDDTNNNADEIGDNNVEQNKNYSPHKIRHSSSMPIQSGTFSYIVREGDTLESISDEFHIKKSLIKCANRIFDDQIHPGQELKLFTSFDTSQKINPIDVNVYDTKEQADGLSGKLSIKNSDLIFTPKTIFPHIHHIDLNGHLESYVFLHPCSDASSNGQLYILGINYLKNPPNRNTSVTEFFSGKKDDLEKYWMEIIKAADLAQEKNNFIAPNPDLIYYSQDFAEKAIISAKKERSGSQSRPSDIPIITPAATHTMNIFRPQIQFINGTIEIIKITDVFLVRKQLSARYQNLNWTRIFKTTIDGLSLSTFYKRIANRRPLLFFLKTTDDDLVGAFIPTSIMISDSHYGSCDMFLFRFKTEIPTHNQISIKTINEQSDQIISEIQNQDSDQEISSKPPEQNQSHLFAKPRTVIETFRWNKLKNLNNKLFILSNLDCILFGGGKTSAIYIDKDMNAGYSDPCETFNSPRLTSKRKFDIALIEVWQIG